MEFMEHGQNFSSDHKMSLVALLFSSLFIKAESVEFGRGSGYGVSQVFFSFPSFLVLLLFLATALPYKGSSFYRLHECTEQRLEWLKYRD